MSKIFADTAGWGHLVDPSQEYHLLAAKIYRDRRRKGQKFITTNYVITELVALLTSPLRISRTKIIEFIESLKRSPYVEIKHIDPALHDKAWQLLTQRQDKEWSFVDCSSFVIMQHYGIMEALTTDHHFEQAGYIYLLKSE